MEHAAAAASAAGQQDATLEGWQKQLAYHFAWVFPLNAGDGSIWVHLSHKSTSAEEVQCSSDLLRCTKAHRLQQ